MKRWAPDASMAWIFSLENYFTFKNKSLCLNESQNDSQALT